MRIIDETARLGGYFLGGAMVLTVACSVGVDDGTTFGPPSPAPTPMPEDGGTDDGGEVTDEGPAQTDTGDDGGDDAGQTDTGGDDATTSGTDGWDATDTGGGATEGDTSDGGTGGGAGPWEQCLSGMECSDGMGCLNNGPTPTDGFCTGECAGFLDPSSCATPPAGGDAVLTCIALGGQNICALDCAGGKTCPVGMQCATEEDDYGTIEICM